MNVEIIPCLKDNYAFLLTEDDVCAVIDPSEAGPVIAALAGRRLTHILNTHHHGDHTGGNLALKGAFNTAIIGPEKDRDRIPGITMGVAETAPFSLGARSVHVLEIPAHTRGAIAFVLDGMAFTGDTLFSLGCGRLFEGTPEMMWESLSKLMRLPDDTKIYCGHEYTLNNGRFALTLEPGNAALVARVKDVEILRQKNLPTIPVTLELEKKTNPFLRPDSAEIRKSLDMEKADTIRVFAEMRGRKDVF